MESDRYAQGMSEWKPEFNGSTDKWDRFQYSIFQHSVSGKTLDVGAGWGRIARFAVTNPKVSELALLEPSPQFCRQLPITLRGATIPTTTHECETSELVKTKAGSFDTVYSVHVLEHILDDKAVVRDCLNLLKPGGRLIIQVPALPVLYSELDRNIGHHRRYTKRMMKDLFAGENGRIVKLQYNDFVGAIGSFLFSKLGKVNYQKSETSKSRFVSLASIYSNYFVPLVSFFERFITPPIGLNLTIEFRKD